MFLLLVLHPALLQEANLNLKLWEHEVEYENIWHMGFVRNIPN
jgi:hypothetical protein